MKRAVKTGYLEMNPLSQLLVEKIFLTLTD